MKAAFDVKDRREADALKVALNDPEVRAFVNIMGVLLPLTTREQRRILDFVADQIAEAKEAAASARQ